MRNFRKEYQEAMKRVPACSVNAEESSLEENHRRMQSAVRRKVMSAMAAAAGFLMLCSVGTVTAVHFHSSRIEVRDNGFSFSGEHSVQEAMLTRAQMTSQREESTEDMAVEPDDITGMVEVLSSERVYHSVSEFVQSEEIVMAIPEISRLDENTPDILEISVEDMMSRVRVHVAFGEKIFSMTQADNRGVEGYASSSVFMGNMVNQRELINDQGFVYQMFDSEEDGEKISTHAAISLNGRDLILNFWRFEEQEIDTILKQLDVTIYFKEE